MTPDRPSLTAQFVAAARALGALLPDDAQLMDDPYGARVAGEPIASLVALSRRRPRLRPLLRVAALPMLPSIAYMQVRTRIIDDVVRRFCARSSELGGGQLVILGAGYDARAARLADTLGATRVFEIDHPATQALKRDKFGGAHGVEYVAWNFESDPMAALASRLEDVGLDRGRPSLTIWEGVTMYLTEPAIESTVAAVRAWSAPGSQLCFSYFERNSLERPHPFTRVVAAAVRVWGEPFRFGWDPATLPDWLASHGFRLALDEDLLAAGRRLLPARYAGMLRVGGRHVAVAEPA
ncbi:MAG: SAM-dependent methyltransferase [Myxococcales bacterium]|nr:SAM-dependent methyltransferase [Myxococcales bacterium]